MNYSCAISTIFCTLLIINTCLKLWLEHRNKKHIIRNRNSVPEKFSTRISLEEHQKASDYTLDKIKTGQFFEAIDFFILIFWLFLGGLNHLDQFLREHFSNELLRGLFFFGGFGFISLLINLPQSIYSTFVIEQKYQFNKTTPKTFIADIIKSLILSVIIGTPILLTLLWFIKSTGQYWWLYAWSFMTLVQLIMLIIYPTLIAPLFNKFGPLPEGELRQRIIELLERTKFKNSGLFVMDASKRSRHGNAYFTGLGKSKRIVFFDNIIQTLTSLEMEAVLAHELGHFKKRHVLKNLLLSLLFSLIGLFILGFLYNWTPFFQAHGGQIPGSYMALMLFLLVTPVYTFILTPVFSKLSRRHEFEADRFAAQYVDPAQLINSLIKLYKDNATPTSIDPLYSAFYHSHPPAEIRIKHLESLMNAKKQDTVL